VRLISILAIAALLGCGRFGFAQMDPDASTTDADADGTDALLVGCDVTHPQALFCDGFEGSGMGPWDYAVEMDGLSQRVVTRAYRGTASLDNTIIDIDAYKAARWGKNAVFPGVNSGDIYMRAFYWLPSTTIVTDQLSILVTANGAPPYPSAFVLLTPGMISVVDTTTATAALDFPRDRWTCVELHIAVGTSGGADVNVDGTQVVTHSGVDTTVAGGYTNLDVGVHYATPAQGPAEVWVDEVVADYAPIGCN
jgi:hypothetical protein